MHPQVTLSPCTTPEILILCHGVRRKPLLACQTRPSATRLHGGRLTHAKPDDMPAFLASYCVGLDEES